MPIALREFYIPPLRKGNLRARISRSVAIFCAARALTLPREIFFVWEIPIWRRSNRKMRLWL